MQDRLVQDRAGPDRAGPTATEITAVAGTVRVVDLRGRTAPWRLAYPRRCVLVVAGIPGAGKTTLLRRLYGLTGTERAPVRTADGALVLDSEQARNRWRPRLRWLPYRSWRPLVHLTHYRWMWRAVRGDGPLVLHECGTRDRVFAALVRRVTRHRRELHVLLIDVAVDQARDGSLGRPRQLHMGRLERHALRWGRLLTRLGREPDRTLPGARSVTVLDRGAADRLSAVAFVAGEASRADDPSHRAGASLRA